MEQDKSNQEVNKLTNGKFSRNKSCGCLIGTSIINLEIQRRKNELILESINKKLKKLKDKNKIKKLKVERAGILSLIKESNAGKNKMKARFERHIKESGYVPPKFKNKRR